MHRVLFAHGLWGSPDGTKATYLRRHFQARTPALQKFGLADQTAMLAAELDTGKPNILVGSSLGALPLMSLANRDPDRIAHLVLLAPALSAGRRANALVEAESLRPGLMDEAIRLAALSIPQNVRATVIHGYEDDVIALDDIIALIGRSPSTRLILVHDDHSLHGSQELILAVVHRVRAGKDPIV